MSESKVVIVDDDRAIRVAARLILEAAGFHVRDFGTAEEAFVSLRHEPADALIVDFDVAHREGEDLAEAICRSEELEDVALIGVAFDVERVNLDLVDLAVAKPYATLELDELVRTALANARGE